MNRQSPPACLPIAVAAVLAQALAPELGRTGALLLVGGLVILYAAWGARRVGQLRPSGCAALAALAAAVLATRSPASAPAWVKERALSCQARKARWGWQADLLEAGKNGRRGWRGRVVVRALRKGSSWQPASGGLWLSVRHPPAEPWPLGSRLSFESAARPIENYGNPGEFDWRGFNERRGVFASAFVWDGTDVRAEAAQGLWAWWARVRGNAARAANQAAAGQGGALVAAMVVGDRSYLDEELIAAMRAAGLGHLLAISGLHVGLVAGAMWMLVRAWPLRARLATSGRDPERVGAAAAGAAVGAYAALSGGGVSVLRAVLMAAVATVALWRGARANPWAGLSAAAVILGVLRPGIAREVGFQLSFAATAVLIARSRRPPPLASRPWIWSAAEISLYCSLVTWPILAHSFYRLPLWAPIANLLATPAAAGAVAAGLAGVCLLPLAPGMARLLLAAAGIAGSGIAAVANGVAQLPGAPVSVVDPGPVLTWALVAAALLVAARPSGWPVLISLLLIAGGAEGLRLAHRRYDSSKLEAVYLAVGHGDASVVRLPGGKVVVVDGGAVGRGRSVVEPVLRRMQVGRIDYLVISHVQADHWPGAIELADEFEVGELWYGGGSCPDKRFEAALERMQAAGTRIVVPGAGSLPWARRTGAEGWRLAAWWPLADSGPCSDNDRSVILTVDFAGRRLVWMGDASSQVEAALAGVLGHADVLKVAHHGSAGSSSREWLESIRPECAIVSAARCDRFGLPREETLVRLGEAGARVWRTDLDGAVSVRVGRNGRLDVQAARRR